MEITDRMAKVSPGDNRDQLLADVSEMYYEEGLTQQKIARSIGVTRSAISRMLAEARRKGIVEIHVHRPLRFDRKLEEELARRFHLVDAHVLHWRKNDYDGLRRYLGIAGARVLKDFLLPSTIMGTTWGSTVTATVDALETQGIHVAKVVQLIGALGAHSLAYDARALVQRLSSQLDGDAVYITAPFVVENAELARCMRSSQSIREGIEAARQCNVALIGVGSTTPEHSSLYLGGHVSLAELNGLRAAGAVGDACGLHFDIEGRPVANEFHDRLIGVSYEDLLNIPTRIGVAGGPAKTEPLLGALRGGYINVLVTNSAAASELLELAGEDITA